MTLRKIGYWSKEGNVIPLIPLWGCLFVFLTFSLYLIKLIYCQMILVYYRGGYKGYYKIQVSKNINFTIAKLIQQRRDKLWTM